MTQFVEIKNVSTIGKNGKRDNIQALLEVLGMIAEPGAVSVIEIRHDDKCPCAEGKHSMLSCTCQKVDVLLPLAMKAVKGSK